MTLEEANAWLTGLYVVLLIFAVVTGIIRRSGVVWCAAGMMGCALLVEQISTGTQLSYLCVGLVSLIGGLIVRDWAFKALFFTDALLNFLTQCYWIAASTDAGLYEFNRYAWYGYPLAVWALNIMLAVLIGGILQGKKALPPPRSGNREAA